MVIRVSRGTKLSNLLTLGAYYICLHLPSSSSLLVLVVGFSTKLLALILVLVYLVVTYLAKSSSSSKYLAKCHSL